MNILKLHPENIKLFETLGISATLGNRKATILPYILLKHDNHPADEFELIPHAPGPEWDDFQRLNNPNI